jgi:hypothetical protein
VGGKSVESGHELAGEGIGPQMAGQLPFLITPDSHSTSSLPLALIASFSVHQM